MQSRDSRSKTWETIFEKCYVSHALEPPVFFSYIAYSCSCISCSYDVRIFTAVSLAPMCFFRLIEILILKRKKKDFLFSLFALHEQQWRKLNARRRTLWWWFASFSLFLCAGIFLYHYNMIVDNFRSNNACHQERKGRNEIWLWLIDGHTLGTFTFFFYKAMHNCDVMPRMSWFTFSLSSSTTVSKLVAQN